MLVSSIDAILTKLFSVVFTRGPITFLVNRYNHWFTQALRNLYSFRTDPKSFVYSDVYISPFSLKRRSETVRLIQMRFTIQKNLFP